MGDFSLHAQAVRIEPADIAQSLQTELHGQAWQGLQHCVMSAGPLV